MFESALYPTIKRFLEHAGFEVKGEVQGCDIVAVQQDEPNLLAVVEMKLGFSLELLLQAVDRSRVAGPSLDGNPGDVSRSRPRSPRAPALPSAGFLVLWRSAPRVIRSRC